MPAISVDDAQQQQPLAPDDGARNHTEAGDDQLQQLENEGPKMYHVLVTGFGPFMNHKTNPSWVAAKALHNITISSDQWQEVFANIVAPTPNTDKKNKSSIGGSSTPPSSSTISSPIVSNGKRSLGNGDALRSSSASKASSSSSTKASSSKSNKTSIPSAAGPASPPLPPLPEPGPFNIHITALEIPVLYAEVLEIIPGLHSKPPKLPSNLELPPDFPEPPEYGYDFILHVGVAGRGPLRMEIIGHKFGYNMKDADGNFCPVVPPPSSVAKSNIDPTRGPGAHPPPPGVGPGASTMVPSGIHYNLRGPQSGGFGSMGMGYNNERLGYNPAVHDPQPAIPGAENSVRPVRGFGTAYESFPDEMMTDIDVTRLVQDLKSSGILQIYTSMDAGHYLCDFLYYCSLAESRRASKALLPYMTATQGPYYQGYTSQPGYHQAQQPQQPPAQGTKPAAVPAVPMARFKAARVLFMHCPPANEPLSTDEVTETIRRIALWVCRECEVDDIREKAQAPEEGGAGY